MLHRSAAVTHGYSPFLRARRGEPAADRVNQVRARAVRGHPVYRADEQGRGDYFKNDADTAALQRCQREQCKAKQRSR